MANLVPNGGFRLRGGARRNGTSTRPTKRHGAAAGWILSLPLLLFLSAAVLFPIGYGTWIALTNRSLLVRETAFVGLANVWTILTDDRFWGATWFTLKFAAITTVATLITGFLLALLFNRRFPGKRVMFTALLLPVMVAPALMGVMFSLLLDSNIGVVPAVLESVGINIALFDPRWTVSLLIVLEILQWTPFTFLVIYAGMQAIPLSLTEAASIDGASSRQIAIHITMPLLVPAFFAAGFLRGVDALRSFDVINVLTGGGPGRLTTTLSIDVYRRAFVESDFGLASAESLVIMLMMLPLVPIVIRRVTGKGLG